MLVGESNHAVPAGDLHDMLQRCGVCMRKQARVDRYSLGEQYMRVMSVCMGVQLYAYTQSPLQRSVLDLFVRCEAVLPNLYIGTLTRDSVSTALGKGLEVEQLLTFLRRHAHPRAQQRSPAVPEVRPTPPSANFVLRCSYTF